VYFIVTHEFTSLSVAIPIHFCCRLPYCEGELHLQIR
jgi:hypothetical protein